MRKFIILCPILIILLTGCMSQDVIESHISYYEGTIKNLTETTLLLETPDNKTITFTTNRTSSIKNLEINDIVYIECEENTSTDEKNIVKVDILEDNVEVNLISRMICIHDNIYIESLPTETEEREGIIDGIIDTSVLKNQEPTIHNQSNFGIDFEYKLINENRVDVLIDDQWIKFIKFSNDIIYYNAYAFNKNELSDETINWLEKYNKLTELEKQNISFVPSELTPAPAAVASNYIRTYHDAFIETNNGNIYIDIQEVKASENTQDVVISVNIINETDSNYEISEKDIQLVKMHKVGDGFATIYPHKEKSTALTSVSSNNSISGDFIFETSINFNEYELLIQTNSGMSRVHTPDNKTN